MYLKTLMYLTFLFQNNHAEFEIDWTNMPNKAFRYKWTNVRVIHQGTVDNNLGPDRLAGPKALDPIYCRQPTL